MAVAVIWRLTVTVLWFHTDRCSAPIHRTELGWAGAAVGCHGTPGGVLLAAHPQGALNVQLTGVVLV